MSVMLSVRLPGELAAQLRQFADCDDITVSELFRRLAETEVRRRDRNQAVDFRLYPRQETVASGGATAVLLKPAVPRVRIIPLEPKAITRRSGLWRRKRP